MRESPEIIWVFYYIKAMRIEERTSGIVQTASYLVKADNGEIYLIDAPDNNYEMVDLIKKEGRLDKILLTHGHFDHIMGLENVLSVFDAPVYLDSNDLPLINKKNLEYLSLFGIPLSLYPDVDKINFNPYPEEIGPFKIIKTPGHTMGSVCLYSKKDKVLFSGDTLFSYGEGRTDLGGDYQKLITSLKLILLTLEEDTTVYPGHGGYTTIEREKERLF